MRSISLAVASALVLFAAACPEQAHGPPRTDAKGDPIAVVAGNNITVEQLQKRLDEQSPFVRARYVELDKKKEFVDSQVRFEVLAAEAYTRGYDQDPEIQEQVKKIIVQKLTREEFDGRVKLADIGEAELQKYFEEHQAEYQKPEMVRASQVAFAFGPDAASKDAAKKAAEAVQQQAAEPAKLQDRNWFKELAEKHSTDEATKRAGGDLRYLSRDDAEAQLGAAARDWLFAGETLNEVSPVLEGKSAWHVLKRTGKRKAITRTYEQVKNQIKNVVFREKRTGAFNTFVDELKKKHGVQVHEEKVAKLKVDVKLPAPGAGGDAHGALMDDGHGHGAEQGGEHGDEGGDEAGDAPASPSAPAPAAPAPAAPAAPGAPAAPATPGKG